MTFTGLGLIALLALASIGFGVVSVCGIGLGVFLFQVVFWPDEKDAKPKSLKRLKKDWSKVAQEKH